MKRYYQNLLDSESDSCEVKRRDELSPDSDKKQHNPKGFDLPDKLKKQIEKVIRCMDPGLYRSVFLISRCYFFLGFIWD